MDRFFLDGIIATAYSAIQIASSVNEIREEDMAKVHKLGKTVAKSAIVVLRNLYRQPIVKIAEIQEWKKVNTRAGAQKIIDRLINLGILVQCHPEKTYGKTYEYRSYLNLFEGWSRL